MIQSRGSWTFANPQLLNTLQELSKFLEFAANFVGTNVASHTTHPASFSQPRINSADSKSKPEWPTDDAEKLKILAFRAKRISLRFKYNKKQGKIPRFARNDKPSRFLRSP
jgi:hypothetical protein